MARLNVKNWLGTAGQTALREMAPIEASRVKAAWFAEQRAVCDQLFGHGFLIPGGHAEVMRLVRPMQFDGEARFLVLGCGVAGPAQLLASQLGVFATGYERLAERLPPAGDGDPKVRLLTWDPLEAGLPRQEFHHALLLNPLGAGQPEPVLANIVDALRPAAQLVLIDYVATPLFDPDDDTTIAWMEREQRDTAPIETADMSRVLARLSLQIRSIDDLSPTHLKLAVFDWRRMVNGIHERPATTRGQVMLDEAETWALRAKLMENGQIRLMRWHAALPAFGATTN